MHPSVEDSVNKYCHIHNLEYYAAVKEKMLKVLIHKGIKIY